MPKVLRRGILSGGHRAITWNQDTLTQGLTYFKANFENELQDVMRELADEAEAYMKANAPWEDRSSSARNGLSAEPYSQRDVQGLVMAHGVDYGIWLEIRWGGIYAIIIPTLPVMGRRMMERVGEVMGRMR